MNFFLLILIIFQFKLFAQQLKDTVFLQKKQGYNIFIDPNKNSPYYKNIVESFKVFPKGELKNIDLSSNWIPLYKYKEEYYGYNSCDCLNSIIRLTNKKNYLYCFEVLSYKNCRIKKINDETFEILYRNIDKKNKKIKINYIDKKRGIAVFKFINEKSEVTYLLMLALDKIKDFPIIVNDCILGKTKEFEFDPIDYEKLLKEKL